MKLLAALCATGALMLVGAVAATAAGSVPTGHVLRQTVVHTDEGTLRLSVRAARDTHGRPAPELVVQQAAPTRVGTAWQRTASFVLPERLHYATQLLHFKVRQSAGALHVEV